MKVNNAMKLNTWQDRYVVQGFV